MATTITDLDIEVKIKIRIKYLESKTNSPTFKRDCNQLYSKSCGDS